MRLTLYLMQSGVKIDNKTLIRAVASFSPVKVRELEGAKCQLYVKAGKAAPPRWTKSLDPILTSSGLGVPLYNQSSAGILLVELEERVFALTFGHGFQALSSKLLEPGFGLRVTANSVATDRLTGGDMIGHGKGARGRRITLPEASDLYQLGIEPNQEWVKRLGGTVDKELGARAVGADSLQLNIRDFSLVNLPAKLKQIIKRSDAEDYKEKYAFLDNLQRLSKDDPLIAELDNQVSELVKSRDPEIGFAAPEPFEQSRVDHYRFKYYRKEGEAEFLATSEVYEALDALGDIDQPLTKIHVTVFDDDGQAIGRAHDLREYAQYETASDDGSSRYVLNSGIWFRVSASWIKQVAESVAQIKDITSDLNLPPWILEELKPANSSETIEGNYNRKLADDRHYALMDKNCAHIGGPNQKVEVCDVLTSDKNLICVKRATRSSTLSHLFAQASVSARLMPEPKYQEHMLKDFRTIVPGADYDGPSGWTFTYAIATDKIGPLSESLFFFSKVNLLTHYEDIRSRGFTVALARIEIPPQ